MSDWDYRPASDLDQGLSERLAGFPREPHLWMYVVRSIAALAIRLWLRLYHRMEIVGRDNLPLGQSFVLVANHQSHLDALMLTSGVPLRYLHRTFPAAAADYFFSSLPRSAFASVVINGLPFDRKTKGAESLAVCRQLLGNPGNVLIIFPEGTRSATGDLGRFRSGIGRLVEGTDTPVVPAYLAGAYEAFPKGALFPRPRKVILRIGEARSYGNLEAGRETVDHICADLAGAVRALG